MLIMIKIIYLQKQVKTSSEKRALGLVIKKIFKS